MGGFSSRTPLRGPEKSFASRAVISLMSHWRRCHIQVSFDPLTGAGTCWGRGLTHAITSAVPPQHRILSGAAHPSWRASRGVSGGTRVRVRSGVTGCGGQRLTFQLSRVGAFWDCFISWFTNWVHVSSRLLSFVELEFTLSRASLLSCSSQILRSCPGSGPDSAGSGRADRATVSLQSHVSAGLAGHRATRLPSPRLSLSAERSRALRGHPAFGGSGVPLAC